MFKLLSCIWIFAFFLGGCAKSNIDYKALRHNKSNVVKNFETLTPQKIEDSKSFTVSLGDEHKEVIMLSKERVFASKFLTTKMTTPFSLDISSSSMTGFFAPKIFFLDEKNKIIKTAAAKDLQFDRGFFKGTIFVNHNYKKIRSIIVTQDLNQLNINRKINYVTATTIPITTGMYTFYYTSASDDQNKTIENAYGGNVRLTLNAYKPAILGEEK